MLAIRQNIFYNRVGGSVSVSYEGKVSHCFLTYPPVFLLIDCASGTGGKRAREMLLLGQNESSVTADDELRYWSVLLMILC